MESLDRQISDARILNSEYSPEQIALLSHVSEEIETVRALSDMDYITRANPEKIEKHLQFETLKKHFSEMLVSNFILTSLSDREYVYTNQSSKREFNSGLEWLMHRNTTQFMIPSKDITNLYVIEQKRRSNKLIPAPKNRPIATWIIGRAYDDEKQMWTYASVINQVSFRKYYINKHGYIDYDHPGYSFISKTGLYQFDSIEAIELSRVDTPDAKEVHHAYNPETKKFEFDNMPFELTYEVPEITNIHAVESFSQDTLQRFGIMDGFTALYGARHTHVDGSIDWAEFDSAWQKVVACKNFVENFKNIMDEHESAIYIVKLKHDYPISSLSLLSDSEKREYETLKQKEPIKTACDLIEKVGIEKFDELLDAYLAISDK